MRWTWMLERRWFWSRLGGVAAKERDRDSCNQQHIQNIQISTPEIMAPTTCGWNGRVWQDMQSSTGIRTPKIILSLSHLFPRHHCPRPAIYHYLFPQPSTARATPPPPLPNLHNTI